MFPYPSGNIHMGHVRNYSIGDVVARCKRMQGFNRAAPMAGMPSACPPKTRPSSTTCTRPVDLRQLSDNYARQLQRLGYSYDWSREIATCRPEYYRWEQMFFLRLLEKGLVYRKKAPQTGAPPVILCLPTSRSSTASAGAATAGWNRRI